MDLPHYFKVHSSIFKPGIFKYSSSKPRTPNPQDSPTVEQGSNDDMTFSLNIIQWFGPFGNKEKKENNPSKEEKDVPSDSDNVNELNIPSWQCVGTFHTSSHIISRQNTDVK